MFQDFFFFSLLFLAIAWFTALSIYYSTQNVSERLDTIDDSSPKYVKAINEESIWQQTSQLIYANSLHQQRWLDESPLKVFVYDTLEDQFSILHVSQCIEKRFAVTPLKCGYYPKICNASDGGMLGKVHHNYNSDVIVIKRFMEYPYRTMDPNEADVFFVPYPHKSHCLCHHEDFTKTRCKFNMKWIREHILDQLLYYNHTTNPIHLFVLGSDYEQANPPFRREISLDLSLGPSGGCRPNRHSQGKHWSELCGSFTIPYFNTMADLQPLAVAASLSNNSWLHRQRKYSVAALIGTPAHLEFRLQLIQNQQTLFHNTVGGLPIYLKDLGVSRASVDPMDVYRQSVFCPILMGDECAQKRFFDVIFAGCIPVVLEFEGDEYGWPSWYNHKRCSVRRTYPFARGTYFDDMKAGIDYASFVVAINGTCGLPCMKAELEQIMKQEEILKKIRDKMSKYALLFTIGLDPDQNNKSPDAFHAMMVTLRHYLRHLVSTKLASG